MTSAPYDNKFKDPRNIDNCVAKRGALFMMTLEKELEERGVNIVHVKTDSMKLVNATQEDVDYAFQRARDYGYEFELECVFEKMALVNKSTLIGKTTDGHWEGVGAQFNKDTNPYVFKTLFSGDEVVEHDFAILKQVQTSIYVNGQFIGKNAEIYASHSGGEVTSTRNVDISKMIRVRMIKPTEKLLPKFLYEGLSQQEIIRNKYERISKELDIPVETVAEIVEAGYPETIVENHYSVTGTKGYQWNLWNNYKGKEDIDMKYYNNLVKDAVDDIFAVGDGNILFAGTKWERKDYV